VEAGARGGVDAADREGVDAATRVIVLRHGQTAWNADTRIQGQLDIPLDDTGRQQAERLALALADEGLDAIYSSDLLRARATAEPLAQRCGLPLATDMRLRERGFGRFEGLTHAEIGLRWPEDAARWRQREPGFAPGGGETLLQFHARCVPAAAELAARHPGQVIALVAHGGVLDALYRAATRLAPEAPRSWQLGNATINRLLWNGSGFVLVGWDDARHLAAPAEGTAG
jgi:probable phosphoglycerate mutase